jgi:hypothetical protein
VWQSDQELIMTWRNEGLRNGASMTRVLLVLPGTVAAMILIGCVAGGEAKSVDAKVVLTSATPEGTWLQRSLSSTSRNEVWTAIRFLEGKGAIGAIPSGDLEQSDETLWKGRDTAWSAFLALSSERQIQLKAEYVSYVLSSSPVFSD